MAGLNTRPLVEACEQANAPVLVSFADIKLKTGGTSAFWRKIMKPALDRQAFRRVMLDSGAFTAFSQGIRITVQEYAAFVLEHGHLFDDVVGLDDIGGDVEYTQRNLDIMRRLGLDPIPVFHQDEDFAVLDRYLAECDGKIGIGFARVVRGNRAVLKYGKARNRDWIAECFDHTCDRPVHGLAMLGDRWRGFDYASTDSSTWINEGCALRKQAPGLDAPRPHGLGGQLARDLASATRTELLALAAGSHDGTGPRFDADQVERESRGQARTALRRLAA